MSSGLRTRERLIRRRCCAGLLVVVAGSASAQQRPAHPPHSKATESSAPLVLEGATMVDVQTGQLRPDQTVVVARHRIRALGNRKDVKVPAGARVVDARGKYLIPGLWNMHAHISDQVELTDARYKDFIVNGVTGAREMGQRFPGGADSFRLWQSEIMAGTRIGPRIVGPSADLSEIQINGPADVPRVMDSLKAAGMKFVKFHWDDTDRATYFAIAREARRVGLPLVGHRARTVSEIELSDSGQQSLEHINEVRLPCWFDAEITLGPKCADMVAHFKKNGTWFTPTLVRFDPFNNFDSYKRGCRPDSLRADMPIDPGGQPVSGVDLDGFLIFLHTVRRMHEAGIRLLPGSDGGASIPIYECTVHVELALFVEAGMTPLEALRSATLSPAQFFGMTDSLGTVASGKLADLVLLDADPLTDIHNTKRIYGVLVNGRYFDRAKLDSLKSELR